MWPPESTHADRGVSKPRSLIPNYITKKHILNWYLSISVVPSLQPYNITPILKANKLQGSHSSLMFWSSACCFWRPTGVVIGPVHWGHQTSARSIITSMLRPRDFKFTTPTKSGDCQESKFFPSSSLCRRPGWLAMRSAKPWSDMSQDNYLD